MTDGKRVPEDVPFTPDERRGLVKSLKSFLTNETSVMLSKKTEKNPFIKLFIATVGAFCPITLTYQVEARVDVWLTAKIEIIEVKPGDIEIRTSAIR